jgi:hypothetical protein
MLMQYSRLPNSGKIASSPLPPNPKINPVTPPNQEKLTGVSILQHYADPARSPEEDLTWMSRALENYALLVKGSQPLPLGSNAEIAEALRGRNKVQLRFLPDKHPAFNEAGEIIDRWKSPLFFHASSIDKIDIRSAGPDKTMWTADDLHRNYNGEFLRGDLLVTPSLYETKPAR